MDSLNAKEKDPQNYEKGIYLLLRSHLPLDWHELEWHFL